MPGRITFIRHAMPEVDAATPPAAWPLSVSGVAAANALTIDHGMLASSSELKALQTVSLACDVGMASIAQDPRFREVDRIEQVHDGFREARRAWVSGALDERHAGWETPDAAARRFHDGLLAYPAQHLVVGTHGMVLTAWLVSQGLIPPGDAAVAYWEELRFPEVIELAVPLLRVRAVLTDPEGRFVLVKRTRPGVDPYWTTPGGGVELTDASPRDALRRELREELGADAVIGDVVHERRIDELRTERFYAAELTGLDLSLREGPEFRDATRGAYDVEFVTRDRLTHLDLRPADLKALLVTG